MAGGVVIRPGPVDIATFHCALCGEAISAMADRPVVNRCRCGNLSSIGGFCVARFCVDTALPVPAVERGGP